MFFAVAAYVLVQTQSYVGNGIITAYCCDNITANGEKPVIMKTGAVRTPWFKKLKNSIVIIEGIGEIKINDCGSFYGKKERKIDLFMSHSAVKKWDNPKRKIEVKKGDINSWKAYLNE